MTPRPGPAAPLASALSMALAAAEISQISAVMAAWRFLGQEDVAYAYAGELHVVSNSSKMLLPSWFPCDSWYGQTFFLSRVSCCRPIAASFADLDGPATCTHIPQFFNLRMSKPVNTTKFLKVGNTEKYKSVAAKCCKIAVPDSPVMWTLPISSRRNNRSVFLPFFYKNYKTTFYKILYRIEHLKKISMNKYMPSRCEACKIVRQ